MRKYILLLVLVIAFVGFYLFSRWTKSSSFTFSELGSNSIQKFSNKAVEGTFEAITPCDGVKPPLPQIPLGTNCEMTIWKATFNSDKTYTLSAAYGMSQQNTMGLKDGGRQVLMSGTWSQEPETGIIDLISTKSDQQISFIKITNELIHLLDSDKKMMIGNGGWSYTLNKINSNVSIGGSYAPGDSGELISGVFEGRTPCQDFLLAFTKSSVSSLDGCQRVKWLITFYVDETTGKPSSYVFGIQDREESHRGTIHVIKGIPSNPDAVVYQLIPDDNRQIIFLQKVGDNHLFILNEEMYPLVGTNSLSYTLSKTANSYELRKSSLNSEGSR